MKPQQTPARNLDGFVVPKSQAIAAKPSSSFHIEFNIKTSWLKAIAAIIVVVVLVAVGNHLRIYYSTKSALQDSNLFVKDIQTDNGSAAYGLTTGSFQKSYSKAVIVAAVTSLSPALQGKTQLETRALKTVKNQPEQVVIIYTVKATAGLRYIQVVLQANRPWRVINFNASSLPLNASNTSANPMNGQ
jgi:hypothetical protein